VKDTRLWVVGGGLAVTAWLLILSLFPPHPPAVAAEGVPVVRYFCRESGATFDLPLAAGPLDNPETGRPTLVPAVYDARRKRWKPGPPLEVMYRMGLLQQQAAE